VKRKGRSAKSKEGRKEGILAREERKVAKGGEGRERVREREKKLHTCNGG
jgi:hypothetical protein